MLKDFIMQKRPSEKENLAMMISLISKWESNPTTKNGFALLDFKNKVAKDFQSLSSICPPLKEDYIDVKN